MYYLAADKHGWKVLKIVESLLGAKSIPFENLGVASDQQDMKLEDIIPVVTKKILENPTANKGILICGTGIGVAVGANKFSGIRAHQATSEEQAKWSRQYDNCNILCLVGWDADQEKTRKIVQSWLESEYDGDKERLKMFQAFDSWH